MTIEEMARVALGVATEDEVALRDWATVETDAFDAYLSDYMSASASAICKGCHGG